MDFTPDGSRLFALTENQECILVDAASGEILKRPTFDQSPTCFAFGAVSTAAQRDVVLAVGFTDGLVEFWDPYEFHRIRYFKVPQRDVSCIAVSPGCDFVATGSSDSTLCVTSSDGLPNIELIGHSAEVTTVAFSPDGEQLVSGSVDKNVRLWDWRTKNHATLCEHKTHVMSVAFSPNGDSVASTSWDYTVLVHDIDGREMPDVILGGHRLWVSSVLFSRDGRTLFTGSGDHTIRIWDVPAQQERCAINAHPSRSVTSLALSPDERILASGGTDGYIRFWRSPGNPTVKPKERQKRLSARTTNE